MRGKDTVRVGLATLAAFGLLVWATYFFRGGLGQGTSYTRDVAFQEAQGLQKGAYVRVRGVDVGEVERVRLAPVVGAGEVQPVVTLRLRKDLYQISAADHIRIVGGLLGFSQPYVEIAPGGGPFSPSPAEPLRGEPGPSVERLLGGMEQLAPNLNRLTEKLTGLTQNLSDVTSDPNLKSSFRSTAGNFAKASASGVVIARNMERATSRLDELMEALRTNGGRLQQTLTRADGLLAGLTRTAEQSTGLVRDTRGLVADTRSVVRESSELVRSTTSTIRDAGGLVGDTRATVVENRTRISELLTGLNRSVTELQGTLEEARKFLGDTGLRADFQATAGNLREATSSLKKTAADLQGLTGDQKVQDDLRATISSLREATAQATTVLERAGNILGSGRNTVRAVRDRFADTRYRVDLVRGTREDRTRFDFDATIPWSRGTFYRVGVGDIGETTRFSAQAGQELHSGVWARYGMRRSRLGVGLDVGPAHRPLFSLDAIGVNRPRGEVRGNLPLSRSLDLTVGLDNLFFRPEPVFGLRYQR